MGTKVECKTYLPGYYSMRDLNEDSNSCNWSLYYGDKSLANGQYYNGFLPRTVGDSYPGYDKDSVKQKMLEHEAIFKNQVHELHRLYRIQRDMMDGVKGNELPQNRIQVGTSLSSSPLGCQFAHSFPMANTVYDRPSPLNSMEGTNAQIGPCSSHNGYSSKDIEVLESRPTKVQRKLFDLQLPADEYIDTEEEEQLSDDKVSAVSSSCPREADTLKPNSMLRGSNGLADLNEPIQIEDAKETNTAYNICNGKSNSRFLHLPRETLQNCYGSGVGTLNNLHLHKNGNGWFSPSPEVGKSDTPSYHRYKQSELVDPSQQTRASMSNNGYDPTFYRSDKRKCKEETVFGSEISKRTPDFATSNNLGTPNLARPWYQRADATLNKSSQIIPALGGESPKRNGFYQLGSKEQPIHIPSGSSDYRSYRNENGKASLRHLTDSGSANQYKTTKDINLNEVILESALNQEMPTSGIEVLEGEKREDRCSVLPWLRAKTGRNEVVEFGLVSKNGQLDCNQQIAESVKSSTSCEVRAWRNEAIDNSSNKKLLGFPIFEKSVVSRNDLSSCTSLSAKDTKPSEHKVVTKLNRVVLDMNLPCDPEEEIAIVEKVKEVKSASFRHHIDLNSSLSDDEVPSQPLAPVKRVKTVVEINLEAPAIPEDEEEVDVTVHEETDLKGCNEPSITSPKCNYEVKQDELSAAETIMAISASVYQDHVDNGSFIEESIDPLAWFIGIVSSCGDDLDEALRIEAVKDKEEDSSEEFDFFELMILELEETKEEDYIPLPLVLEDLNLDEAGPTLSTSRPRKGQARRGRKRRDFQRDILPGLASLSRYEVTEDLQTFEALMLATGNSWHSGLTRRSSARRNGVGRGGRRRAAASPTTPALAATTTTPSLMQMLNGIESAGTEDRQSLASWGKTTRRPRRQRCAVAAAAGNPNSVPI